MSVECADWLLAGLFATWAAGMLAMIFAWANIRAEAKSCIEYNMQIMREIDAAWERALQLNDDDL